MLTRDTETDQSVGDAAKSVSEHLSSIMRLEVELASIELKKKVASLGVGIGLGVGALVLLLFMLGFFFLTIAAGLDTFLPTWAALLIVTGILLVGAGLLAILARGRIQKGTPPMPEQAIREAKLTTNALKSDGSAG
jgi:uncharacterized membrane protein YqjE